MDEGNENKIEVRHETKLIEAHEPALPREEPVVASTNPQPETVQETHINTPGVIILQWLSYAFWGWLILALVWLVGIIVTNAITGDAVENVVPYAMAATIVLLPVAFVTDLFYRKHEPAKKTGVATVIMVIHVVLYALLGIGTLIGMVFTALSMVIGSSDSSDGQMIALWVLGAATLLYAATFVRVLNPFKAKRFATIFGFGMLAVTLGLLVWGMLGPVITSLNLKDDRRIENNLSEVSNAVNDYVSTNKSLPDRLSDVEISSPDSRSLVNDGLVRYKKVGAVSRSPAIYPSKDTQTEYRYQLCVTYDHPDRSYNSTYYAGGYEGEYRTYVSTYGHPAGEVCYKLAQLEYGDTSTSSSGAELTQPQLQ